MSIDPTPPPPTFPPLAAARAAPLWMRLLLAASLALNLLVLGFVLGDALDREGPGRGPRPVEFALGPLARALSPEDRKAILDRLADDPALRPLGRDRREAGFADLRAALEAEPFDPGRARAVLDQQDAALEAAQDAVGDALVERLAAMAPAERRDLAGRLGHGPGR